MENTNNIILNPNPYGVLSAKELANFEKKIACKLPSEYESYLLQYNGGKFTKTNYLYSEVIQASIHHMYGLHDGPGYLRLEKNYAFDEYYDLEEFSDAIKKFIVFADTPTGELFLLNIQTGAVHFFDKAAFDGSKESLKNAIIFFEKSFYAFVQKLISDEELDIKLKKMGVIDEEFEQRLARAKKLRSMSDDL